MITHEQKVKAQTLLDLHHNDTPLVLLNAWDPGSARLIAACGVPAIATTSMGVSASLGYPDREAIPLYEMAEAIGRIVNAVQVPVTADIEGGYGASIEDLVASVADLMATGIVGGNVEDSHGATPQLFDEMEFCERLRAIRELADSLGFHFVINARTDVFLAEHGKPENRVAETIRRGNKYLEAGADCIFVPNVTEEEKIAAFVNEINGPVNVLVNPTNGTGFPPPVARLKELGVRRISFGSSIMKAMLAQTKKIAEEVIARGTYDTLGDTVQPIASTQEAYKMATTR